MIDDISKEDRKRIEQAIEKATEVKKDDIIQFDKITIRRTLFFRVFISGTIEFGNFETDDPVKMKYDMIYGDNWEKEDGSLDGMSHFSVKGEGSNNYNTIGQHFSVSFRSTSPFGWPQIVLTCTTVDSDDFEVVYGYGVIHVPASTGRHERVVHIFQSNVGQDIGLCSRLFNINCNRCCGKSSNKTKATDTPKVIGSGEGRNISTVSTVGWVKITFQVNFRDMDKFGLVCK